MLKRTSTSSGGRQADFPVITDWDVEQNRGIAEILGEAAEIGGWTTQRALANYNFGPRNVRQNECARASETTPKKRRITLDALPGALLVQGKSDEAIALANELKGGDDALYERVYDRVFPNGTLGVNGDEYFGAEETARQEA